MDDLTLTLVDAYDTPLLTGSDGAALWRAYLRHLRETPDVERYRAYNRDLLHCLHDLAQSREAKERIAGEIEAGTAQRLAGERREAA